MMILFWALMPAFVAIGIVLSAFVAIFFVEVLFARRYRVDPKPATLECRMAILVPAHDEASIIADTVSGFRAELRPGDRLIVVADNCTDGTAELARTAGAETIRREDRSRRGKGYALDCGIKHLAANPPDVVVFMDADCRVAKRHLYELAGMAALHQCPVQAFYDILPQDENRAPSVGIASFAHRVKSCVRPKGLKALGLPCLAIGTGIAFPWSTIASAKLASSQIVEDLVLGLELAREGKPPLYAPEIEVISHFPTTPKALRSQRTRWETGHMNVIARILPSMGLTAIRTRNWGLLALIADAAVPPLAFVALALAGYGACALVLAFVTGFKLPLWLFLIATATLAVAVLDAWSQAGRGLVSIWDLLRVPLYIVRKATLYGRIALGQRIEWVRTPRE
jgi:cellulose synthase/poly-beta-1,6-N-acetylglucosamine synthase-like glycosyltransferase